MLSALDILDQLELVSGQNDKIGILRANVDNLELKQLLDAAMNFDRKFYVKKFNPDLGFLASSPTWTRSKPVPNAVSNHEYFIWMLEQLENRIVTGHDAQRLLNSCFHVIDKNSQESKWYRRVLLKDLRCNFGISLANKAGFNLHEFEVMLAKDGKECKKLEDIVAKGVYASPKLNGYRALAICQYGNVTLHSRNGLEYENFPTVVAALEKLCQNSSFILDGECMSDDFNKMQQTAMSYKSGKSVGDIKYHVFGWIPVDEWKTKIFKMPTKERLENLQNWFKSNADSLSTDNVIVEVLHELLYSVNDAMDFEKQCISQGYEGAMLLPNMPYYVGKKSNRLLKLKTFKSWDCKVVAIYEGEGKNAGKMGGITVLQENNVECNLGTGWSDEDREYMWNCQDDFIGRTIEVQYQDLTPDLKMQFPSVVRWRIDK